MSPTYTYTYMYTHKNDLPRQVRLLLQDLLIDVLPLLVRGLAAAAEEKCQGRQTALDFLADPGLGHRGVAPTKKGMGGKHRNTSSMHII